MARQLSALDEPMKLSFSNIDRILAVLGAVGAGGAAYAAYAADRRVAPVEHRVDTHIAVQASETEAMRKIMDRIDKRTFALCRATPNAKCEE